MAGLALRKRERASEGERNSTVNKQRRNENLEFLHSKENEKKKKTRIMKRKKTSFFLQSLLAIIPPATTRHSPVT